VFASLRTARRFSADMVMAKVVDGRGSSEGGGLGDIHVIEGVLIFFALMWRQ